MSNVERPSSSSDLEDLIDQYLSGLIDEADMVSLEAKLLADEEARRHFVRYCQMETDLGLTVRACLAGKRALRSIDAVRERSPAADGHAGLFSARLLARLRRPVHRNRIAAAAAVVLLALGTWALLGPGRQERGGPSARRHAESSEAIAWLVNAQDCQWVEDMAPGGDMQPGRTLRVERGLAEVAFLNGAHIVLEGPARLELLSSTSARLLRGKAAVRVPEPARGFTVLSPQARVVDLGTEFGISVAEDGSAEVIVFEGQVEASLAHHQALEPSSVTVAEDQAASLKTDGVTLRHGPGAADPLSFVRKIVPARRTAPRNLRLDFATAVEGSIRDSRGAGTGFMVRLPGTGTALDELDPNLLLHPGDGKLELTATPSDINTQFKLDQGEYAGVRLSDFGFTGSEDFAVSVSIPDIPSMEFVGQFGLYAGARSSSVIRGGLISRSDPDSYELFLVNNDGGLDSDLYLIGLLSTGDDLRLTLRRAGGKYSLAVENQTTGSSSSLAIRHPRYLDTEKDLFVGLFAANPRGEARRTLIVKEFEVKVWTVE